MSTLSLSERVKQVADDIYKSTIRDTGNWIDHWHGPGDHKPEECKICLALGLTAEDWDEATRSE